MPDCTQVVWRGYRNLKKKIIFFRKACFDASFGEEKQKLKIKSYLCTAFLKSKMVA